MRCLSDRPAPPIEQLVVRHPTRMHLPPNALLGRRPWPWTVGRGNARQRARACVRACMHACVRACKQPRKTMRHAQRERDEVKRNENDDAALGIR